MGGIHLSLYFILFVFVLFVIVFVFIFFRTSVFTSKFGGGRLLALRFSSPLGIVFLPTMRTLYDSSLGVWKTTIVHFYFCHFSFYFSCLCFFFLFIYIDIW
jgi:hypothetical protein